MTGRPNVLFLVADSLRYDVVADEDLATTPTLDQLATEGTNFKACYSQGISTAPSMTAMLTGRYPLDYGGHWYIHEDQPTMAEQFADNGYHTAAIHSNPNVSRLRNFDKGFKTFEENILPLSSSHLVDTLPDSLLRYLNKGARVLSRTPYLPADSVNAQIQDCIGFINEPWFLWTQYMDTHGPYLPGDNFSYRKKFRAERLWRKAAVESPEEISKVEHEELRHNYRLEVEYFDAALGRFLEKLETSGQLEETIIIIVGDHGDEFGEHGQYGHGNLPYEELVHVPLVIRFPDSMDLTVPDTVEVPVRCLDILPTLLETIDAELTESMEEQIEGESLMPVLQGGEPSYDIILTEKEMRDDDALRFGFRTEEWTYLYDGKTGEDLLYNTNVGHEETSDVSASEPDTLDQFRGYLQERLETINTTSTGIETPTIEDAPGVQERLEMLGYKE